MVEHQFLYKNLNCDPEAHHILALSESGGGDNKASMCSRIHTDEGRIERLLVRASRRPWRLWRPSADPGVDCGQTGV